MAKKTYFVTGTNTDVGKTVVTASLLEAAKQAGKRTLAMKPVASGCEQTPKGLRNSDALILQNAMTEQLPYDVINPIALEPAIAPHVAAAKAGRNLSANRLAGFCRGIQLRPADLLLIEGAGGWRVPLNDRETYSALAQQLNIPVVLVVSLELGCINHALLSAEAIGRDGLVLAGWVANRPRETVMSCEDDTLAYLKQHLGCPCLGVLPWLSEARPQDLAKFLNVTPLIEN
jgi:dethiobiotin synthetase